MQTFRERKGQSSARTAHANLEILCAEALHIPSALFYVFLLLHSRTNMNHNVLDTFVCFEITSLISSTNHIGNRSTNGKKWSFIHKSYRASRQVIGRDCSQKILSPSIHIVVGNFCEQSLPITCRTAQYMYTVLRIWSWISVVHRPCSIMPILLTRSSKSFSSGSSAIGTFMASSVRALRLSCTKPYEFSLLKMFVQMCSPKVTLFLPGLSVTASKRHYSHAYLLKERPFGTSWFCHCSQNVTIGVVTVGEHICKALSGVPSVNARARQKRNKNHHSHAAPPFHLLSSYQSTLIFHLTIMSWVTFLSEEMLCWW